MQAEEDLPDVVRGVPADAVIHLDAELEARSHRDRLKRWQKRYVVVANNFLYLFSGPKDRTPKAVLFLEGAFPQPDAEEARGPFVNLSTPAGRGYDLRMPDDITMDRWMNALFRARFPALVEEVRQLERGIQLMGEAQAHSGGVMTQSRAEMAELREQHVHVKQSTATRLLTSSVQRWYASRVGRAFTRLRLHGMAAEREGALARERRILAKARAQAARAIEEEAIASVHGSEAAAKARDDAAADLAATRDRVRLELDSQLARVRESHTAALMASREELARARHALRIAQTQRSAVLLLLGLAAAGERRSLAASAMHRWSAATCALRAREASARADLAVRSRQAALRTVDLSAAAAAAEAAARASVAERDRDAALAALAALYPREDEPEEQAALRSRLRRLGELHAAALKRAAAAEEECASMRGGGALPADVALREELRAQLRSTARAWLPRAGGRPAGGGAVDTGAAEASAGGSGAVRASLRAMSMGGGGSAFAAAADAAAAETDRSSVLRLADAASEAGGVHAESADDAAQRLAPEPRQRPASPDSAVGPAAPQAPAGREREAQGASAGVGTAAEEDGQAAASWKARALEAELEAERLRAELQACHVQMDLGAAQRAERDADSRRTIADLKKQVVKLREQRSLLKQALLDQRAAADAAAMP